MFQTGTTSVRRAGDEAAALLFTTRTTRRVAFGPALLAEAARTANGRLEIRPIPDSGTRVAVTFGLANMPETLTFIRELITQHTASLS